MLIGNLGADPEVRYMSSGEAITNIRLATTRRWKDRQTGEQREATEWHRIVFFNIGNYKLAEIAGEYLKKGRQVYVEGHIQTRKWQDNTGQDRYTTEIVAEQMQMLGSRSEGSTDFNAQDNYGGYQQQPNQNFQQNQQFNQQGQQFNRPAQQQPAQQFNQPPAQQAFNQGQQNTAMQQPPVNQGQQQAPLQPPPVQQGFNQQSTTQMPPQNSSSAPVNDDFDDDIPF